MHAPRDKKVSQIEDQLRVLMFEQDLAQERELALRARAKRSSSLKASSTTESTGSQASGSPQLTSLLPTEESPVTSPVPLPVAADWY